MSRISGMNFDINVGDMLIHVETATLDITDNSAAVQTGGVPDGWVDGDVSASGELELDTANFNLMIEAARKAGSFRRLEPFDSLFYAKTPTDEIRVEAFGCKPKISSLLNIDPKGGEKSKHKVPFDVTSPDFIHINGVPYLDAAEIEGLR
ncbi:phage protein [Pseudomonas putida]|uniref:Phage tail protein n=1 Tax=Pseudomonas putida TaxID=303 RepID=A0A1X1AEV4_PSEPU|nr:phage protein [Pseudomonas putida]ORL64414.1 phage tail protein [Pseudomonas putida]ORL70310.1 phage tail protein [Pseudomonas putida]